MNSQEIHAALEQIAATSSKNDKQALITKYSAFPLFVRVLEYTYNPFKTYGVAKRPDPITHHANGSVLYPEKCNMDAQSWGVLDDLIARRMTGAVAVDTIAIELGRLNPESAEVFWRIIKKDLRAGFSESTCNKVVKGLIPDFPYMRCSLPKDAKLVEWPWAEGAISQLKADGMFANVDHEVGGVVSITSRQGSPFPIEKFAELANEVRWRLRPGFQNHGEIIVMRGDEVLERQIGNGMLNSVLTGGDFEPDCRPVYQVWDQIPLEAVTTKGKHTTPYRIRLAGIIQQLRAVPGKHVELIPTRVVKSLPEAYAHAAEQMRAGREGTVIKHPAAIWKDGTSKEQVKIKLEFEVDLKIVGIVMGREGTKNDGRAGSFACESSDGKLKVDVTVKNEAVRDRADEFVGTIIAVTANDIMEPSESNDLYSLFLPRMSEADYRKDKSEADSLERIFAQKEAAIFGEKVLKAA